MKRIFLAEIFLVGISVAILHQIALSLSFYWTVSWYDVMMHFLGGFLMALIILLFAYDKNFFNFSEKKPIIIFLIAIGFTLIIGLSWELWEVYFGFSDVNLDRLDTIKDLIMDFLGSIAAFFYAKGKICQMKD